MAGDLGARARAPAEQWWRTAQAALDEAEVASTPPFEVFTHVAPAAPTQEPEHALVDLDPDPLPAADPLRADVLVQEQPQEHDPMESIEGEEGMAHALRHGGVKRTTRSSRRCMNILIFLLTLLILPILPIRRYHSYRPAANSFTRAPR